MSPPTSDPPDSKNSMDSVQPSTAGEGGGLDTTDPTEALVRIMENLPGWVNEDEALVRRGRFLDVDCMIDAGGVPFYLSIREGRITKMERGPAVLRPWRFCIGISAEGLNRFWAPVPEAGWHDLFALAKRGEAVMEGDVGPLMANLRYFKELLATPRRHLGSAGREG